MTKVVLQSEASECGIVCLVMVGKAHGLQLSLRELRARFPLSLKGANLSRLIFIAQELGFQSRPLRLDMEHLPDLKLPCILHWDLNHFVVLTRVSGNKVTILDPASGKRVLDISEVSEHFTGIALELMPSADFKPQKSDPGISIEQLTGHISGLWRGLATIFALSVALQVFAIIAPFFMQWVVDQVLVAADRNLMTILGLGFGLALVLHIAIGLLRGWAVVYLSARLGLQWMGNVFSHLLKLPLSFFEKRHLGDVVSRMGSIQAIQHTLTTSFVEAMIDGLMAIVFLVVMLIYSWKLALVTFAAVALYLVIRLIAFRPLRDATEQQLVADAKQQTYLLESIRGMQSLKLAAIEPQRNSTYQNLMNETVRRDVGIATLGLGFNSVSQLVFGIERIAVIWIGALLTLDNVFSVGMLIAYLAYKDQFAARVSGLIDKAMDFRMLKLHGERLSDIVLTEPEHLDNLTFEKQWPTQASLTVANLSFRYADGEPWVVQDCSFTVGEGQSVAIVGPSGCGKTTLCKVLLGLLPASEGKILIGDQDINRLGPHNYRRHIAAVMQDDQLFAGSVAENIAFGEDGFDLPRIEEAAQRAAVHEEITAMPMGYHSLIGDMGTTLSGGQKQRVILARALYRKPRILFLDEATSHLDVERERLVNDAVRQLKLTKIIIAHRPETIASADRVLVMQHGQLHELDLEAIAAQQAVMAGQATGQREVGSHLASEISA